MLIPLTPALSQGEREYYPVPSSSEDAYMDVGGRVTHGAVTERVRVRALK